MGDNSNIYNDLGIGILASGNSRRLEQNKAFLKCGQDTFLDRSIKAFNQFKNVYISTNFVMPHMNSYNNVLLDEHQDVGPMEGIYQILSHSNCEYNFICGVDMPFIDEQITNILFELIESKYDCYVVCNGRKLQPTCAIYSKTLQPLIKNLIDKKRYCLLAIFDNSRIKVIDINNLKIDKKLLTNINTIDDYNKYCK